MNKTKILFSVAAAISVSAVLFFQPLSMASATAAKLVATHHKEVTMNKTYYRYANVKGLKVFYREAGDPKNPTIVLLHGFPTSSHMYRELIPALADKFHLVAPDYIGFGQSDAPSNTDFKYTFAALTEHVDGLLEQLNVQSYILYMQDYGGPIGFRLFAEHPEAVKGFVVQNSNAYMEGVGDAPKKVFLPLWEKRDAASEAAARSFLTADTTKFQYTFGAKNPDAISPDNWTIDQALLDRPGTAAYQIDLLEDYKTNVGAYDAWYVLFKKYQPKTLIVWGKNDPFFIPAGAEAFKKDIPAAKIVWYETGHFALEEHAVDIAGEIKAAFPTK
ncbi:MAG: alpha/beta hydrolase [Methylovulum miyakonense]|uniref:alpha/beta fold hydrolase n=1 Tax=Methylovulum miyakonense TaxID=645578 RepID=UPI003BB56F05